MKKMFQILLVTASIVGSYASASELTAQDFSHGVVIEAIRGDCTPQPAGVKPMRYCNPEQNGTDKPECPPGYSAHTKYCFAGWGRLLERCGYTCDSDHMYDGN